MYFERDVMNAAVLSDTVDSCNVLVVELRGGSSLLVEAADDLSVGSLIGWQKLERDVTLEFGIERPKHRSHPPCADRFLQPEVADEFAGNGKRDRSENLCRPPAPFSRTTRAPQHRQRWIRPDRVDAIHPRLVLAIPNGRLADIGFSARIGAQHRIMLNSLGRPRGPRPC